MSKRVSTALVGVALALALGPPPAVADTASHQDAAREFYAEAAGGDSAAVGAAVARMLIKLQPGLAPHREAIEEYAEEVIESEAYREARAAVYAELFTEEELRTLTWLFRHATYRKFRERRLELLERNTQVTMDLFRRSLPDLQRRLGAGAGTDADR